MEGMLIFAGLFSAVLTAFLIESYKTLNPDPGDLTVLLLTRISEQIVASARGNASNIPPPLGLNDGGTTRAALVCNALWFLSLGLSLSCALIATLLEQWAREFLHRTDIHSAPVIRARVFSFLYYGLRRFNMHAIVDIIPLLLHLSLLLFFAGLVAFLAPVHTGIALIAAVMLFIIATTYSVLTVFPLRYLDSPYRTPLTGLFWKFFQYFKIQWSRHHLSSRPDEAAHSEIAGESMAAVHSETASETMVAAITRVAAKPSDERASRDLKALVWTVNSLADDTELEPFVDAISDILWGSRALREAHYARSVTGLVLHALVNDPRILLHERITNLYRSCNAGILTPAAQKRRKIICSKALWTTIPLLAASDEIFRNERRYATNIRFQYLGEKDLEVLHYARSVEAMTKWREFETIKLVLNTHLEHLQGPEATSGYLDARRYIAKLTERGSSYFTHQKHLNSDYGTSPEHQISTLLGNIRYILTTIPHLLLLGYLQSASRLHALPYYFARTVHFLRPQNYHTPPTVCHALNATFDVVVPHLLDNFNSAEFGWMDSVMNELIQSWKLQDSSTARLTLHPELLRYLNHRRSKVVVFGALLRDPSGRGLFWEALANTLESTATRNQLRNSLTAAWGVMSMLIYPDASLISRLLKACIRLDIPSVTPSLISALKWYYIRSNFYSSSESLSATDEANSMHEWLAKIPVSPADADMSITPAHYGFSPDHPVSVEYGDALVALYTEYLEICAKSSAGSEFPHEAEATIHLIMSVAVPKVPSRRLRGKFMRDTDMIASLSRIHDGHQIQFAHALRGIFDNRACEHLRFTILADTWLFRRYLDPSNHGIPQWLDNPTARDSVIGTLTQYVHEMENSTKADRDKV
ncbi:hypothetical protein R3P38DRAFT_3556434, partial [Favolaschia claudopus]